MILYDSLKNDLTELKTLNGDGIIKIYTFVPSLYNYSNIGNIRAYIFMDTLIRIFEYNHYTPINTININDIQTMEYKNNQNKNESKNNLLYYDNFFNDLKNLNIKAPKKILKTHENIDTIIKILKTLENNNLIYIMLDGVYFDSNQFECIYKNKKDINNKNLEKIFSKDFMLWKFVNSTNQSRYESPWGFGCPIYNIELSILYNLYFNNKFDIYIGNLEKSLINNDNHIINTITQRNMYNNDLILDYKNNHNIDYNLQDIIKNGYTYNDYRYLLLQTHYKQKLYFNFEKLKSAHNSFNELKILLNKHKDVKRNLNIKEILDLSLYMDKFSEAINNDLNTPNALKILWEMLKTIEPSEDVYNSALRMNAVFGLNL